MGFIFFVCLRSEEKAEEIRRGLKRLNFVAMFPLQMISGKTPLSHWLDFVCERGCFIKFFESYSPKFLPHNAKPESIIAQNNIPATDLN